MNKNTLGIQKHNIKPTYKIALHNGFIANIIPRIIKSQLLNMVHFHMPWTDADLFPPLFLQRSPSPAGKQRRRPYTCSPRSLICDRRIQQWYFIFWPVTAERRNNHDLFSLCRECCQHCFSLPVRPWVITRPSVARWGRCMSPQLPLYSPHTKSRGRYSEPLQGGDKPTTLASKTWRNVERIKSLGLRQLWFSLLGTQQKCKPISQMWCIYVSSCMGTKNRKGLNENVHIMFTLQSILCVWTTYCILNV